MANIYVQFSARLTLGTTERTERAFSLFGERKLASKNAAELDELGFRRNGCDFDAERISLPDGQHGILLYAEEDGDPQHVVEFVLRLAQALDMQGMWAMQWSRSCSKARPDEFGGGAVVINLAARTYQAMDTDWWVEAALAHEV